MISSALPSPSHIASNTSFAILPEIVLVLRYASSRPASAAACNPALVNLNSHHLLSAADQVRTVRPSLQRACTSAAKLLSVTASKIIRCLPRLMVNTFNVRRLKPIFIGKALLPWPRGNSGSRSHATAFRYTHASSTIGNKSGSGK